MRYIVTMLLLASRVAAQTATFTGRVLDGTDSLVISGVLIRVEGAHALRTDGFGRFTFGGLQPGKREVIVRMLGYAPFGDSIAFEGGQTLTRDVYLSRIPRLLSTMVVKGRSVRVPSGFEDVYGRGAKGSGFFITRERIDSLSPRDVTSLLSTETNAHISGYGGGYSVTTPRCRTPVLYLNGMAMTDTVTKKEILQFMAPSNIQAIEMYDGSTRVPVQFQPACGVIAVWTRKQ